MVPYSPNNLLRKFNVEVHDEKAEVEQEMEELHKKMLSKE